MRPEQEELIKDGKLTVIHRQQRRKCIMILCERVILYYVAYASVVTALVYETTQTVTSVLFEVALYWLNVLILSTGIVYDLD